MGSRSIVYVGIYALIYQYTILGEGIVSRDGLPRGEGFHSTDVSTGLRKAKSRYDMDTAGVRVEIIFFLYGD